MNNRPDFEAPEPAKPLQQVLAELRDTEPAVAVPDQKPSEPPLFSRGWLLAAACGLVVTLIVGIAIPFGLAVRQDAESAALQQVVDDYIAAVTSGDFDTAQRMAPVDESVGSGALVSGTSDPLPESRFSVGEPVVFRGTATVRIVELGVGEIDRSIELIQDAGQWIIVRGMERLVELAPTSLIRSINGVPITAQPDREALYWVYPGSFAVEFLESEWLDTSREDELTMVPVWRAPTDSAAEYRLETYFVLSPEAQDRSTGLVANFLTSCLTAWAVGCPADWRGGAVTGLDFEPAYGGALDQEGRLVVSMGVVWDVEGAPGAGAVQANIALDPLSSDPFVAAPVTLTQPQTAVWVP